MNGRTRPLNRCLRTLALSAGVLATLTAATAAAGPADDAAAAVVNAWHGALTDAMRSDASTAQRHQRLAPLVAELFDTRRLAQLLLRRDWATLDADQQAAYTAALSELTSATYAARFGAWSGEQFVIEAIDPLPRGRVQVRSTMTRPAADDVQFSYQMESSNGGPWKIINVVANGVSDAALRGSQHRKMLEKLGFDGLIARLSQGIAEQLSAQ